VTEPRRILIDWDYAASGIWWCATREEHEAPRERWRYLTAVRQPGGPPVRMPELTAALRDDLKAWNQAFEDWTPQGSDDRVLREQGRELADRVQDELGTDEWEVLYKLDGRVHRVHPPGNWPALTWPEELLGYSRRKREP
jgi:hypothetical protein